jgi:hypothetical protein
MVGIIHPEQPGVLWSRAWFFLQKVNVADMNLLSAKGLPYISIGLNNDGEVS